MLCITVHRIPSQSKLVVIFRGLLNWHGCGSLEPLLPIATQKTY